MSPALSSKCGSSGIYDMINSRIYKKKIKLIDRERAG